MLAVTRARKRLTLTRARRRRSPYGSYEETIPSRFLDDFPSEILQGSPRDLPGRFSYARENGYSRWETPSWLRSAPPLKEEPVTRFKAGMQVKHATYGRGVVKASRLELGDETVEVYFEGYGLKALVASLANLEVL